MRQDIPVLKKFIILWIKDGLYTGFRTITMYYSQEKTAECSQDDTKIHNVYQAVKNSIP